MDLFVDILMGMMRVIIAVPLYRRSRPQGVSGACCGKASYYSGSRERERVIVRPVISIVTQHKRFLLERKIGNSWKVSPLTIQLLHTHTHIYIFKKITIFQQILHSYLKELFIYHTHLEKVKTRIRIQSHLNSYIIILDKPNQV